MNIQDLVKPEKKKLPGFGPGDTVKVQVQVVEGEKRRLQAFQGIVIQLGGSGMGTSFTVRKVSGGVGVERIFPLYSPMLSKITVVKRGRVRRAKLFYLRERKGKSARIAEKREAVMVAAKATEELKPAEEPKAP
jgi:large subunit ribosomal protein L19